MDNSLLTSSDSKQSISTTTTFLAEVRDLTSAEQWSHSENWFQKLHAPAFGRLSNAEELSASHDGKYIAFTSVTRISLEETHRRVHIIDLDKAGNGKKDALQAVTQGPYDDKMPKWCPNSHRLVFLSDRRRKDHFLLYAIDARGLGGDAHTLFSKPLDGVVEEFEWSRDGASLLFRLAALGLPKSGFEGSGVVASDDENFPVWMPKVASGTPGPQLRSLWLLDIDSRKARQVSQAGRNVWRFAWAGHRHVFALVSYGPGEGQYKHSSLVQMSLEDGSETILRLPDDMMLGELASPVSGAKVAFPEAVGGERTKVAGPLVCLDVATQRRTAVATRGCRCPCAHLAGRRQNARHGTSRFGLRHG
jgi:dipeptidyl aminopeptidase/acylaminoacyl peptidase